MLILRTGNYSILVEKLVSYFKENSELLREETFSLTINNRAFLYADGFFETIKVIITLI